MPVNIIFDSDMDGDCDDVAALALLHVLADRGEATILATIASSRSEFTPQCIDAINTWYGRGDLPIGAPKKIGIARVSKYTRAVAGRLPHTLKHGTDPEDAVELYRRLLIAAPDHSITIVTVGFHTNLAALLESPANGDNPAVGMGTQNAGTGASKMPAPELTIAAGGLAATFLRSLVRPGSASSSGGK